MENENQVRQLINNWPSRKDFAEDISVSVEAVHKWISSGVIPSRYWRAIINVAKLRNITVSAEELVEWHSTEARCA